MSANQHGTHQALIMALAGDYTGGVAVASLLRGVPILGVHPNEDGEAMSLWLAGHDAPAELLASLGLEVLHDHRSDHHRPRPEDVLYDHYRLVCARPARR